jgi:DNA-binding beta-propeller fold protein YncE
MKSQFRQRLSALSVARALPGAVLASAMALFAGVPSAQAAAPSFIEFESGHVRPLAVSADGNLLFAVNTPNNTLEIFRITNGGLQLQARVPVGMEPVAVAQRTATEVWVVNHLSDSVSVVSLEGTPRVVRTLLVGDEPRDVVFAGAPARAFITTAHRGQRRTDPALAGISGAVDAQINTPGVGRADVWVFDPANLGADFGGIPMKIMSFFADTPRALAVSPDKNTVYVAAYHSGNETASVNEEMICDSFDTAKTCKVSGKTVPGGRLGPATNADGKPGPRTAMLVKFNRATGHWEDEIKRVWDVAIPFTLPDKDVFAVDANALKEKVAFQHVGTTLYNMAVNPVSGALYVSNTEANNMTRFEGPGVFGKTTVQGKIALSRVTVIANSNVAPRHLNKHIDYSKLATNPAFDASAKNHSLATPLDMAVTKDGRTLYVTAFGSSKIGVFSTSEMENDSFNPRSASSNYITVSGGGPSGVVLDEARGQMYVMTRFDNAVKVVNLASRAEVAKAALPNPEPANIIAGRPFLYDAQLSSANGEASCASCHAFGDKDELAWDLGNPDDQVTTSPIPGKFTDGLQFAGAKLIFGVKTKINGSDKPTDFHPMKGPMTTQTLKGMRNSGAMHWRGDRSTGIYGTSAMDSTISFKNFGVAFSGLLGNTRNMTEAEMQTFADFMLNVQMQPNPIRNLDNSLTASQKRGSDFYFGSRPSDGFKLTILGKSVADNNNCNGCHVVDAAKGQFGTGGFQSFEGISQIVKVPQLRNMYEKVGRFGAPSQPFSVQPGTGFLGEQIRGFGFVHDGSADTLAHFFTVRVFAPTFNSGFPMINPNKTRSDVADFMHAIDSDLAPIVGQQATLTASNAASAGARIDLMIARAKTAFVSKELGGNVTECDLVAQVVEGGAKRGYLYDVNAAAFVAADGTRRADSALRALASTPGQEVTYTCAPPGSGARIASTN